MPPLELSQLELAPRHLTVLRALLARHVPDAEVWTFGSRVAGDSHQGHTSHESSDLDLVLHNVQDPAQAVAGRAALCEALPSSALPILVEVHDSSQWPELFRQAIGWLYVVIQTPWLQTQKDAVR